ncbi:MAG TPA: hypothetical protein VK188_10505 [Holophaga sp.]|nr:hypothetical protein [Holophaga sp.]
MKFRSLLLVPFAALALRADLPPEVQAKIIKVIVSSSGGNKIACGDPALKAALEGAGLVVDSGAPIVWSTSAGEAKNLKAFGRLIITDRRELAGFASIVIQDDGGRPKIMLNPANLKTAKVQLSDAVMKIAEKI